MTKITNVQECQTPKKTKIKNKGVMKGINYNAAVTGVSQIGSLGIMAGMLKVSDISNKDMIDLSIATQEGLKKSGLAQKGVKVFKVKESGVIEQMAQNVPVFKFLKSQYKTKGIKNDKKANKAVLEEVKQNKMINKIAKLLTKSEMDESSMYKMASDQMLSQIKGGYNACYLPKANKVIIPDKHLQTSVFHELGHAMNANGSALTKALQKCRPLAKYVPIAVLAISLLNKTPKNEDNKKKNESQNIFKKVANGIKNHAGLISGLAMAPMVLEEGLASLRGQKLAKSLVKDGKLSKELFKRIKLTNLGGFASYTLVLIATAIACEVAIKVKDKAQQKYEDKKMMKDFVCQYHQG